jgi:hypothetical protein
MKTLNKCPCEVTLNVNEGPDLHLVNLNLLLSSFFVTVVVESLLEAMTVFPVEMTIPW